MSISPEEVEGQLSSFKVFEALIKDIDLVTGDLIISTDPTDNDDPYVIPPVYYGGVGDAGIYQHPEIGDTVICTRVYPGGKGIVQAIRIVPSPEGLSIP